MEVAANREWSTAGVTRRRPGTRGGGPTSDGGGGVERVTGDGGGGASPARRVGRRPSSSETTGWGRVEETAIWEGAGLPVCPFGHRVDRLMGLGRAGQLDATDQRYGAE